MMAEKERAEGLSAETIAWLDASEKSLEETEKKIASGEISQLAPAIESGSSHDYSLNRSGII
jgi:hypothetical protein